MTKNPEIGVPGNCPIERQLVDGLAHHYGNAQVWDIVRNENQLTNDKYRDAWTPHWLVSLLLVQFSFLSDNIVSATRYLLEHAEERAQFRADPEKAVFEIFRLGAPVYSQYTINEPKHFNVSYTKRVPGQQRENVSGSILAGLGQVERVNLNLANRDPRKFSAPNTFKPQRPEWLDVVTFGAPLNIWYDIDPASGTATFNPTRPVDDSSVTARYYCPGFYMIKEIALKVITKVLDSQEPVYAANRAPGVCVDDAWEIGRIFGYPIYPEYSVCRNAMARMDARYERGVGCEIWGDFCCASCQGADTTIEHMQVTRKVMMRTMWFPDQFTYTDTFTYKYFLATQRYWDDESIVEVTPTGKKNYYKGPESILEYYSLQNRFFNPPSYRISTSSHNQTMRYFPKWDRMLDDNRRLHSWNLDPALTIGLQPDSDPDYDFSQFVWRDEVSIYPVSRAYHDFRKPTIGWLRKGLPGTMSDVYGDVTELCHTIQVRSTKATCMLASGTLRVPPAARLRTLPPSSLSRVCCPPICRLLPSPPSPARR